MQLTLSKPLVDKMSAALEAILPRGIDVLLVVLILRSLAPEDVGLLETSQTIVTPTMLLFLSPEQLLYKCLPSWKSEADGTHLSRVRSLRHFCWLKGLAGVVLALLFSLRADGFHLALLSTFLWAFSRSLAPQIIGIDREYLRICGRFRDAFLLVFSQKLLFLIGTLVALRTHLGQPLVALACAGVLSTLASVATSHLLASSVDGPPIGKEVSSRKAARYDVMTIFREAFTRFSLWAHVEYVIANSIESMDVLTLGVLGFSKRTVGIYGAAVRVANFGFALPMAISMWYSARIGQAGDGSAVRRSAASALRPTLLLLLVAAIQTLFFVAGAPLIAQILGSTRWTDPEKLNFSRYLVALALGCGVYILTLGAMTWLKLLCDVRSLFFRIYAPWLIFSAGLYYHFGSTGNVMGIAWANIACYAAYGLLIVVYLRRPLLDTFKSD